MNTCHFFKAIKPKSLQRSPAVGDFYETGIEIWPRFVPVGITKKKWTNYEQLLRPVFSCFHGQKMNKLKTL